MWGSPFFPGIFTSASRSCLMLLNPKKSHFFTCHPNFKSHFLLPPLTSPAHTNLSSSCVYSSRAALTAWSAPMVGCRFHSASSTTEKAEKEGGCLARQWLLLFARVLGELLLPREGPQSARLFPAKCLEEKPICLHSVGNPQRRGLPGELEHNHWENPHSFWCWGISAYICNRAHPGNPRESLKSY